MIHPYIPRQQLDILANQLMAASRCLVNEAGLSTPFRKVTDPHNAALDALETLIGVRPSVRDPKGPGEAA